MILSGHQPVYLPGILVFNKMALSDLFMYVGHVQFSNKSWQQRNRIVLNGNEILLTVPVRKSNQFGQSIDDVEILDAPWKRKHLGSIRQAYSKRPFFKQYFTELEETINRDYANLGELNRTVIALIRDWLSISTPIVESYDYPGIDGTKTNMLIQMCKAVGANKYLSNEGARVYVDETVMANQGIQHCWQVFRHPLYEQGQPFMPDMSAIDLVFNMGPESGAVVKNAGFILPS
jgi:hypothetical protein